MSVIPTDLYHRLLIDSMHHHATVADRLPVIFGLQLGLAYAVLCVIVLAVVLGITARRLNRALVNNRMIDAINHELHCKLDDSEAARLVDLGTLELLRRGEL